MYKDMYTDSDICVGRSLTLTFATFVHMIDNPTINHLPENGIVDLQTGLIVNYATVTTVEGLIYLFKHSLPSDKSDLVILRPDNEIGIKDHDTLIVIIKRKKDTVCFYRNPWGVEEDTEHYKEAGREHPMQILERTFNTSGIIFIKPEDSMVLQGSQKCEDIAECKQRLNPIDVCLAEKELGACVTWNEYYIDKVKTWLAVFPEEFEFGSVIEGIKAELVGIDSSVVFGDDSFQTLAEYGARRWSHSPLVPYQMIREIFEAIPSDISDVELQLVTNAYDMFMRDMDDGFAPNLEQTRIFLRDAIGYKMIQSDTPDRLCHLMSGYLESSCGEFIVDITMILISCKIRLNERIAGKRKLDDDSHDDDVKVLKRPTSFIDI